MTKKVMMMMMKKKKMRCKEKRRKIKPFPGEVATEKKMRKGRRRSF